MRKAIPLAAIIAVFFFSCRTDKKEQTAELTHIDTLKYKSAGDSIIKLTFDTLRNALTRTISEKGVAGAISFCSVNAYPITALYAREGLTVRRTALRYRNPGNSPDSLEKVQLEKFTSSIEQSASPEAAVVAEDGRVHYFKPIMLQAMCKNCHGDPATEISAEALSEIQKKYPADHAVGFREGDLRGMWHLIFEGKK